MSSISPSKTPSVRAPGSRTLTSGLLCGPDGGVTTPPPPPAKTPRPFEGVRDAVREEARALEVGLTILRNAPADGTLEDVRWLAGVLLERVSTIELLSDRIPDEA